MVITKNDDTMSPVWVYRHTKMYGGKILVVVLVILFVVVVVVVVQVVLDLVVPFSFF